MRTIDIRNTEKTELTLLVEATDPNLLDIFDYERYLANLSSEDIHLMVPEEPEIADQIDPKNRGDSGMGEDGAQYICIFPIALSRFGVSERRVIRHELAHIKYGDTRRNLPWPIQQLYNFFIAEPRARRYEHMYY